MNLDRPTVPISVVVPTIGRVIMLERCLESIARGESLPTELLVVDQSGDPNVEDAVSRCAVPGARVVRCDGHGVSRGVNRGLREARSEIVSVTHDDCTVRPDWVGQAWRLMHGDPGRLLSGRILADGDPLRTPSIRTDDRVRTYGDRLVYDGVSAANLVLNREVVLNLGGFDERLAAAEDSDLCYRWLRSGRRIEYRPELVVFHRDWRTTAELERLYVEYWRGGGRFYGKHLRGGDLRVLPLLAGDVLDAARGAGAAIVKGTPRWADPRRGFVRGFPIGLISGFVGASSARRPDQIRVGPRERRPRP